MDRNNAMKFFFEVFNILFKVYSQSSGLTSIILVLQSLLMCLCLDAITVISEIEENWNFGHFI